MMYDNDLISNEIIQITNNINSLKERLQTLVAIQQDFNLEYLIPLKFYEIQPEKRVDVYNQHEYELLSYDQYSCETCDDTGWIQEASYDQRGLRNGYTKTPCPNCGSDEEDSSEFGFFLTRQ